jgi:hypothetical protein
MINVSLNHSDYSKTIEICVRYYKSNTEYLIIESDYNRGNFKKFHSSIMNYRYFSEGENYVIFTTVDRFYK